ncbi:MAG TPA: MFS transporter [Reyranella sp.]|nr:MFS transporter [Reyranella sp.]
MPVAVVAAAVAGNALEFFDFVTYAFFAVYIAEAFFPAKTEFMSLLVTVGVFGVGFVFRPLGGVIISAYADRAGRKPAMLLTIAMITIGTAGLALTPSYASIGVAAPVIVIVCRMIQGLALGGDVGPASTFLVEIAPPGRRGFYSSWQLASQGMSGILAGGLGTALSLMLDKAQMAAWGWRVPFVLGLALIPVALYLRRAMPETMKERPDQPPQTSGTMVSTLFGHGRLLILGVLLIVGGTVATYVANYLTTYAITTLHFSASISLSATLVAGCSTFLFSLLGGWLADRFGRRVVMIVPRILLTLLVWPAFLLLAWHPEALTLYLAAITLTALTAMSSTASLVAIPELLPASIRATGLGVTYALGVSLFGGSTQFVITWLLGVTQNPVSPAWYVVITSLITLGAMLAMPESRHREL